MSCFLMLFATVRFEAWSQRSFLVAAALDYLKHLRKGEHKQGIMETCKISFDCVIIRFAHWSLIFYGPFVLFFCNFNHSGPSCETVISFSLPAEKKGNLNFADMDFLFYCKMFHCFVDTLNRLMSRLWSCSATIFSSVCLHAHTVCLECESCQVK